MFNKPLIIHGHINMFRAQRFCWKKVRSLFMYTCTSCRKCVVICRTWRSVDSNLKRSCLSTTAGKYLNVFTVWQMINWRIVHICMHVSIVSLALSYNLTCRNVRLSPWNLLSTSLVLGKKHKELENKCMIKQVTRHTMIYKYATFSNQSCQPVENLPCYSIILKKFTPGMSWHD